MLLALIVAAVDEGALAVVYSELFSDDLRRDCVRLRKAERIARFAADVDALPRKSGAVRPSPDDAQTGCAFFHNTDVADGTVLLLWRQVQRCVARRPGPRPKTP